METLKSGKELNLPFCNKPCKDCPFKKSSTKGWLGEKRAVEIATSSSFVCHKNTSLQCGGYLAFQKKTGLGLSDWLQISARIGIKIETDGSEIFDSLEQMKQHHKY